MKLTLKKNNVMQLSGDLEVVPLSQTKDIAGGGTNGCTGTFECEHTGQCPTTPHMCARTMGCTDPGPGKGVTGLTGNVCVVGTGRFC
jgi:hypothetical protein